MSNKNTSAVLILGHTRESDLADALYDLGFLPLNRGDMFSALHEIRYGSFRAIFVCQNHAEIDALEFILNVRDFDEQTPIFVLRSILRASEKNLFLKQQNVLLFDDVRELLTLQPRHN